MIACYIRRVREHYKLVLRFFYSGKQFLLHILTDILQHKLRQSNFVQKPPKMRQKNLHLSGLTYTFVTKCDANLKDARLTASFPEQPG